MAANFVDLNQVVKDWAWKEYDRTATKKQRQLREKERKKQQTYLSVTLDWSEVKFKDETLWKRVADDKFEDENENEAGKAGDAVQKQQQQQQNSLPQLSAEAKASGGAPRVSILFQTKFTNNTKDTQEYTLRTEKTTRSTCSTSVESGFTQGIDLSVTLKTPCEVFEANAGYHREFSLVNSEGETFEEELSWGVESVIKVKPEHIAEANLVVNEKKQAGDFVIETRIRGTVYVTFTNVRDNNSLVKVTGHEVSDILEEYIKQERRKGQTMDFIEIADNVVRIKTAGHCRFRYGVRQEVLVNQMPLLPGTKIL